MYNKLHMKIAQYRCSIPVEIGTETFSVPVEALADLDSSAYNHEMLVWNNREPFTQGHLSLFPKLKSFINWGTDDDNFDQSIFDKRGIAVKRVDYYATETLAEYTVSLMLMYERKHLQLFQGEKIVGNELHHKKVGIVGLGKIGFRTASMLQSAFGCEIYYYGRSDKHLPGFTYLPLEQLCTQCDYIIIATKSGSFSIDVAHFNNCKPELVVVNIARDSVLPLRQLLPMLQSRKLRGYVGDLDITNISELDLPRNVLISPKKAYLTQEAADIKRHILLFYIRKAYIQSNKALPPGLHIVRHGETEWNKLGLYQGSMDSPLSDKGRIHAQEMAAHFADSGIKQIYTSPLGRARQTADIIAEKIGATVTEIPLFSEMNFGIFEGKKKKAVEALFDDFYIARKHNVAFKLYMPNPGGESYFDVYLRVLQPFTRILAHGEPCIIVGHESINRMLRGIALEKPLELMVQARQKNNEVVSINLATDKEQITSL
jgi:probable phosphoglycerate mutase